MMEDSMESCVPPGFRFHPTDEELVGYYLRKKVASQKIHFDVIREMDLNRIEPWDLQEKCWIGYEEQKEWYFFSHKDKKYPTGTRSNRATMAGFWKATGRDKAVYDHTTAKLIGMRKTLVFYKGRAPNGHKSDWIMHEYRLHSQDNTPPPPQEEGWVVCRAFKKRITYQARSIDAWESSYFYNDPSGAMSVVDPIDCITRHNPASFAMIKQENIAADGLMKFTNSDQFVQLPQLESPSHSSVKRPSSISEINDDENEEEESRRCNNTTRSISSSCGRSRSRSSNNNINNKVMMDWRALDKFVASRLSSCLEEVVDGVSSFEAQANDLDMDLFLSNAD